MEAAGLSQQAFEQEAIAGLQNGAFEEDAEDYEEIEAFLLARDSDESPAEGVVETSEEQITQAPGLANLRAFPFSKIKIDQSFIKSVDRNTQSAAIVRAVLGLGSGLDIPVIAEGVERPEELEFLRAEVCKGAQGYLISRPATISEFKAVTSGIASRIDIEPREELLKAG